MAHFSIYTKFTGTIHAYTAKDDKHDYDFRYLI